MSAEGSVSRSRRRQRDPLARWKVPLAERSWGVPARVPLHCSPQWILTRRTQKAERRLLREQRGSGGRHPTGGLGGIAPATKVKNEEAAMHPPETSSRESLFMGRSMSPLLHFGHSN